MVTGDIAGIQLGRSVLRALRGASINPVAGSSAPGAYGNTRACKARSA